MSKRDRGEGDDTSPIIISEAEWQESKAKTDAWAASFVLPHGWIEVSPFLNGQRAFACRDGRRVLGYVGKHDGHWWLHVSVSRPKYIPSYDDLADVKRVFIGDERQGIQVFPKLNRHVNIHPYCLHLWARLEPEGDGLPDFGSEGTI